MSAKLIPSLMALFFVSNAAFAAGPVEAPRAARPAHATVADPVKVVTEYQARYKSTFEDLLRENQKAGNKKTPTSADIFAKMNDRAALQTFARATQQLAAKAPGLRADTVSRLILASDNLQLPKEVLIKRIEQIGEILKGNDPAKKDAAQSMVDMMEIVSVRMHEISPTAPEYKVLQVLIGIDLQALPNAVPVVKAILRGLNDPNKKPEQAVQEGMTGIKGTLEDFVRLCRA